MRRIVKSGPLPNAAARDHCLQYMVAVALLTGNLTAGSYDDEMAKDPRINALRARMNVTESPDYTRDHHDPRIHSCANSIQITARDGAVSERIEIHFPVGDPTRRDEAAEMLSLKFRTLSSHCWGAERQATVIEIFRNPATLGAMSVLKFMDYVTEKAIPSTQ